MVLPAGNELLHRPQIINIVIVVHQKLNTAVAEKPRDAAYDLEISPGTKSRRNAKLISYTLY